MPGRFAEMSGVPILRQPPVGPRPRTGPPPATPAQPAQPAQPVRESLSVLSSNEGWDADAGAPAGYPRPPRVVRHLTLGGVLVTLLIAAAAAGTLWQSRQDAWDSALRQADNLRKSVIGYMDQHLRLYMQALDLATRVLSAPEFGGLSGAERQVALETIAQSTDYVGSIMQLDADGNPVRSSIVLPQGINFADRSYFAVHRDNPMVGVFVSQPFTSRLRPGWIIGLSRRLSGPDGSFAGVVVVAVRLAYIETFLSDIDMGPNGAIILVSTDGTILARQPPRHGRGGIGTDLSGAEVFKRIREMGSGSFAAVAAVDGVERLYTFAHVPEQPLIVNVAPAISDIFAVWWRRTIVIGFLTLATCALVVLLTVLLRRELARRARIEKELCRLSLTDALTGLPNRRRYDEVLRREWRRTRRTGAPLALLLLDADEFKKLNDRHGHAIGDEALKMLARTIEGCIRRPGDVAARYGGEEFVVVLPDTTETGARVIAEAIRAACERLDAGLPRFTVSIGVAATHPTADQSVERFQEAADKALYRAKQGGRNRVEIAE